MFDPLLVQGAAALIILLMGIFIFKRYPLTKDLRSMNLCGFFAILSILLSYLSIQLPLFGFDSFRIGFAQIMLVIGGSLVAPGWAFLMGIVADFLGILVQPTGYPFLGFTLNSVLACVIPSLWYYHKKSKLDEQSMLKLVDILLVLLSCFAAFYVMNADTIKVSGTVVTFEPLLKIAVLFVCVAVSISLILVLHFIKYKMKESQVNALSHWVFTVLIIEIVIQFCCTPFWLEVMYGIPWTASLFLRVIKACVMIPCNTLIGYATIKVLNKVK